MTRKLCTVLIACLISSHNLLADNWLARISDNTYVSQLSIPGTHDASTGEGFTPLVALLGNLCALTQDKTLAEQWDCGVRAFDLRPAVHTRFGRIKGLHIFHGIMQTKIKFTDAIDILREKLAKNPTEFAIVIMRHENDADKNHPQWGNMMREILTSDAYKGLFADYKPDLTVGNLRGKILVLSRDMYNSVPIGGYVRGWSHVADFPSQGRASISGPSSSGSLYVQDFYDTSANGALETKVQAIITMLDFSTARNTDNGKQAPWVINHTSGYSLVQNIFGNAVSLSDGYRHNASVTNKTVIDYFADGNHTGPAGMVMIDYAGVDVSGKYKVSGLSVINTLIENNFRSKMMEAVMNGIEELAYPNQNITVSSEGLISANGKIVVYATDGTTVASGINTVKIDRKGIYIIHAAGAIKKVAIP